VRQAANGWVVSGTATEQTGFPITALMSNNPSSCTTCTNPAYAPQDGGATGGGDNTSNGGSSAIGRAPFVKRNGFSGPGVHNLDMRIGRDFALPYQSMKLEFFAEAFNIVNHRNGLAVATTAYTFLNPSGSSTVCNSGGHANSCIEPYTVANPTNTTPFGVINSTSSTLYGPRQLQFTAKLFF